MSIILSYILRLFVGGSLKGIFQYFGERRKDRNLIQQGIDKAGRENAIKAAKRANRVAKAASKRYSNSDILDSLRNGFF